MKLMNRIKSDQVFPDCFEPCNITSIWKSKGAKNDFENYRGVFRVTVFRNILDRLIYNDQYPDIDSQLTDCNVGSRKHRNIRDHIYVLNAILNSVTEENNESLDLQVYDTEKTFDTLWLHEVVNDLYEAGFNNDKLNLIFLESKSAQVAVRTQSGMSRRITLRNIIMQGTVWAGLCCTVMFDKLGKLVYSRPELMYKYKGTVSVPPMEMVDDILAVTKCSKQSIEVNAIVNTFMETKKLKLNKKKCHKIHIQVRNKKLTKRCPNLKVHGEAMNEAVKVKYLGDQVAEKGSTKATIEERKAKGFGIISEISAITDDIPLGPWRIKSALLLRQAMLINGTMFNSECWQSRNISKDILELTKPDMALHRNLVNGHSKVPLEYMHLEMGTVPLQFVHKGRRLNFHKYILNKDPEELVSKIYEAQQDSSVPGDFCNLISEDMNDLDMHMSKESCPWAQSSIRN